MVKSYMAHPRRRIHDLLGDLDPKVQARVEELVIQEYRLGLPLDEAVRRADKQVKHEATIGPKSIHGSNVAERKW